MLSCQRMLFLSFLASFLWGCGPKTETIPQKAVRSLNPDHFVKENLVEPIRKEVRK